MITGMWSRRLSAQISRMTARPSRRGKPRSRITISTPHVVRFAVVDGGDHVPGGAAAGHQIEGGEAAGDVEGFVIGGGAGRGEAELFGSHPNRRQHDDGIHLHASDAVFDGMGVVVAVAIRHRQPVVEESHVEFAGLQDPADLLIVIRRHRIVARFRMAP